MSVRVNLLPGEVAERNRAARQRAGLAAGAVAFLALLGVVYVVQASRVGNAREQLEQQQARVAELESEVAELEEFGQLAERAELADRILAAALGSEASVAGVLQDLAAVFPSDAELTSLGITIQPVPVAPTLGGLRPISGTMTAAGRTIRGHAPGLERLLLELEKVAGFENIFFASSTLDEAGVSTFSVDLNLGDVVRTNRYVDGLPEELR